MNALFLKASSLQANREVHETLLAEPLGKNLYELKSIPTLITSLNYGDIVTAIDDPLRIVEVIVPSGFQTFRIAFLQGTNEIEHREVVYSLRKWQAVAEMVYTSFYAISVAPHGNMQAIRAYLSGLKQRQKLLYEPDTPLDQLLLVIAEKTRD